MVRPTVYNEPRKNINVLLPVELLQDIDKVALGMSISRTELVYSVLANTTSNEESLRIAEKIREQNDLIKDLSNQTKDLQIELRKSRMKVMDNYKKVTDDPLVQKAYENYREKWEIIKEPTELNEKCYLNLIYEELERLSGEKELVIKSPLIAKQRIKAMLRE